MTRCRKPGVRVGFEAACPGRLAFCVVLSLGLSACTGAPSVAVVGSYFPSWMLCTLAAIATTLACRMLLVSGGWDRQLPAPVLVYVCLCASFSLLFWLIWLA